MNGDNWKAFLVGLIVIILLGVGVYLFFSTADLHTVVVTAQQAVYEVPVEDFQPRKTGGWDETVPEDAYDRNAYSKQRGSHQQYTGQTCVEINKQDVCTSHYITLPDYDTWVDYTVDRWGWIRNAVAYYNSSHEALTCPNPDVKEDAVIKYGSQRELPCVKHYSVTLQDGERSYTCAANSDAWFSMTVDTKLTLKFGRFTQQPWCDTIAPATP